MKPLLVLSFVLAASLTSRAGLPPDYVERILRNSPRVDVPERPRGPGRFILYVPIESVTKTRASSIFGRPSPFALKEENGALLFQSPPREKNPAVKMTLETPSPLAPPLEEISLDELSFRPLP